MARVFFFLLGFGLMVIGFTYIITYLNLLSFGYTFTEYLLFISKRLECLFALIGFLMVSFVILLDGRGYHGLYL